MSARIWLVVLLAAIACKRDDRARAPVADQPEPKPEPKPEPNPSPNPAPDPQAPGPLAPIALDCPKGTSKVQAPTKDGAWCARPDGTKHGPVVWRYDNGKLKQRGSFFDGEMHGEFRSFTREGTTSSLSRFRRGRLHGHQVWWFPSGKKSSESHYVNGRYHGTHINYDRQGRRTELNEYVHGDRVKTITYRDGKEVSTQTFKRWTPKGPADTRSHPRIPAKWQACKKDHECTLIATTCCACGGSDYVSVSYMKEPEARKRLKRSCEKVMCPQMMCQRVGARCDKGRCVSAE